MKILDGVQSENESLGLNHACVDIVKDLALEVQQMLPLFNKASAGQSSWRKLEIVPVVGALQEDSMRSSGEWIDPRYVECADGVKIK